MTSGHPQREGNGVNGSTLRARPAGLTSEERARIVEEEALRASLRGKSPVVAVLLSVFVAGLGDLYCGSWFKALVFFGLGFVCFLLTFVFGIGFVLYFPLWICGLISAWRSAARSQSRALSRAERAVHTAAGPSAQA